MLNKSGPKTDPKTQKNASTPKKKSPQASKKSGSRVAAKRDKTTLTSYFKASAKKIAETFESALSSKPSDVVAALKADHESLRNFLGLLKDTKAQLSDRKRAYLQFEELLKSHSKAEEQAVYEIMVGERGREMHLKIAEGYVEHQLATDLMKRIAKVEDPIEWSSHANVLSEIVEHHLKEEERDLFPKIKKSASSSLEQEMLGSFLSIRKRSQKKRTPKNAGVLENA